jgi:hypothetical protein
MSRLNKHQALCLINKAFFYYRKNKNNIREFNFCDTGSGSLGLFYLIRDKKLDKLIYKDCHKTIEVSTGYRSLSIYLCNRYSNSYNTFEYELSGNWFMKNIDPVYRKFAKIQKEIINIHKKKIKKEIEIAKKEDLMHFNQIYDELFPDIENIILGEDKEEK